MTDKLNQYYFTVTIQQVDNRKLTVKQLDEITDQLSFNLAYALHGTLYYQIDKTNNIIEELKKILYDLDPITKEELRDCLNSIIDDYTGDITQW